MFNISTKLSFDKSHSNSPHHHNPTTTATPPGLKREINIDRARGGEEGVYRFDRKCDNLFLEINIKTVAQILAR